MNDLFILQKKPRGRFKDLHPCFFRTFEEAVSFVKTNCQHWPLENYIITGPGISPVECDKL